MNIAKGSNEISFIKHFEKMAMSAIKI